jgi:hypothetical protein
MNSASFEPFDEFQKYLLGISFEILFKDKNYTAASKRLHKRILALLIVEFQICKKIRENSPDISASIIPYLEEFRSDILSAMMILHFGLYKATLMSARAAIENIFRVIAGMQETEFKKIKTVFELVDLAKNSPHYSTSKIFKTSLDTLIAHYGEYCNYVHSNGENYLSKDRKLADLPRWDPKLGAACADSLLKIVQSAICIFLILKPSTTFALRHDQKDLILDALPMKTKAGLTKENAI